MSVCKSVSYILRETTFYRLLFKNTAGFFVGNFINNLIYVSRYNVDCAAASGLYGGAEGAFGGQGGDGGDANAGAGLIVIYRIVL